MKKVNELNVDPLTVNYISRSYKIIYKHFSYNKITLNFFNYEKEISGS